jgi:hypothetical protein
MMGLIGGSRSFAEEGTDGQQARLEMLAPDDMAFETDWAHRGARMEHDCD